MILRKPTDMAAYLRVDMTTLQKFLDKGLPIVVIDDDQFSTTSLIDNWLDNLYQAQTKTARRARL